MLTGRSILHVNQDIGRHFSVEKVSGYYNNLIQKVTMQPELLETDVLPTTLTEKNERVFFPVAIFQYGLGAYDLFLENTDSTDKYLHKFMQCLEWAVANQEPSGAWNNFFFSYPDHPYGAMAQGEGASLLIRGYVQTKDIRYMEAAQRAIDFMLKPVSEGGTTDGDILLEYTHLPAVMNGWIFAWWGLYDYVLTTQDKGRYKEMLDRSCLTLESKLPLFTNTYWSMYDLGGHIASPFYHHLHIAQMQAMYMLTGHDVFCQYAKRWEKAEHRSSSKIRAFLKKAWQKIRE